MTSSTGQHFFSGLALAELPWFGVREGRLVLEDDSVGPVIDVHTHLALTFLRRRSVDLCCAPRPAEHYLPQSNALDMEAYQNVNFTPADLRRMKWDLGPRSVTKRGMRATHTVPNLLGEMDELGVLASVLLPIDFPVLSWNAEAYLEASRGEERLVCLGSVHSHKRRAAEVLEAQKRDGARGIKVHPAVQLVEADHPKAMAIYRACADLNLPVLWHCGPVGIEGKRARRCSQVKHYWRAIHENPDVTFILGHSGALQVSMGLELAQRYPNVHLELASQGLSNVRRIVEEAPIERVMFGSDWPFYHQSIGIAKVLMATEDKPAARRLVLRENAARLFGVALGE